MNQPNKRTNVRLNEWWPNMPTYRTAGVLKNGCPIFHKFETTDLIPTLRTYNISQYVDYDLYMDIGEGKEQLLLEINNHEITYGDALYDRVTEDNILRFALPPPTKVTPELVLIDVPQNHRKIKLKKAL